MANSSIYIVVIDDLVNDRSPLIVKLRQEYSDVNIFNDSASGLEFISQNITSKMIVILDIKLSGKDTNGHVVLDKIREISYLIPVIIWSATDEKQETFSDFINNKAFAFVKQSTPVANIIKTVKDAESFLSTDVASSLEDWILARPIAKNQPYMISLGGKEYTLDEILAQIRQQTEVGREFSYKLNKLTIDLLLRNKEELR